MNGARSARWALWLIALAACHRASPEPATGARRLADMPQLPEDPVKGAASEAQWARHLKHEEDERQLGFDRRAASAHRSTIQRIEAARELCERVSDAAALARAHSRLDQLNAELHGRVKQLDPWGTNSRLLEDYAAIEALFAGPYLDAKLAALKGDPGQLDRTRAELGRRLANMKAWLKRAEDDDEESEENP